MRWQVLMNDISSWSTETFGNKQRNPAILYHLKKEVEELIEALEEPISVEFAEYQKQRRRAVLEYADCFILLLDSADKFHLTANQILSACIEKLEINKARTWGEPDANGVIEHIKDQP